MTPRMDPDEIYHRLKACLAQMPTFGSVETATYQWMGEASLLVKAVFGGTSLTPSTFDSNLEGLGDIARRMDHIHKIRVTLYRAFAIAEAAAPSAARGGFIPAGARFEALRTVSTILKQGQADCLFVDPYMGSETLMDFAREAKDGTSVRLLTDRERTKPGAMQPLLQRWQDEFGPSRPIEIRFTPRRALHDRLVIVDQSTVYLVGQSFKDLAKESPSYIQKAEGFIAVEKCEAYEEMWTGARSLAESLANQGTGGA